MTTPDDAGTQLEAIATALSTLATAEKTRAEAASTLATTQKTLADAQTVLLQNEAARAAAATTLEKTRLETDAQRLANDKAASDQRILERKELIASVTGAVPDVSTVAKNTVTYADGAAVRGAELTNSALGKAAAEVASAILGRPEWSTDAATRTLLVTSTRSLIADLALRDQISAELAHLVEALSGAAETLSGALNAAATALGADRDLPIDTRMLTPIDGALVVAAAAGATATQLARLAEVDASARMATVAVPARAVHAAVIAALRGAGNGRGLRIRHESMAVPSAASAIIARLSEARTALVTLTAERAEVPALAAQLTARVSGAEGDEASGPVDGSAPPADGSAPPADGTATPRYAALLATLTRADARAAALIDQLTAFSTRVTTATDDGRSPLAIALSLEGLDAASAVLIVGGATGETVQMTVARRFLMPRLHVSAGVGFDWFLLEDDFIVAAGHAHGAESTSGRVGWGRLKWRTA
ncbi:hypothetical protein [Microbacterium kunmingense]|uniref:hypothetical protein n=1 Tax=Microbacterium kunmingense TaxID=2915939 RepID=UPI003D707BD6